MINIPCHGGKDSNKRNKRYQKFSPFPEAHKPDVLTLFFPPLTFCVKKERDRTTQPTGNSP